MKKIILIGILVFSLQLNALSDTGLVYKNKETVIQLLKDEEIEFTELDKIYKNDKEIVHLVLELNPYFLEYMDDEFKKDKALVKKLVTKYGFLLKYAGRSLQKDRELIDLALKVSGYGLQYLNKKDRDDKTFVLKILKKNPYALEYVSQRLKKDKEVVFEVLKQIGNDKEEDCEGEDESDEISKLIDKELLNDKAFVVKLLNLYPQYDFLVSKELKKEKEIKALLSDDEEEDNEEADDINISLLGREEAFKLLKESPWSYEDLNTSLKKDIDFILPLLKENSRLFEYMDEFFTNDKAFVLPLLNEDFKLLHYVGKELKKDNAFILDIFQKSGEGFEYLNVKQKSDKLLVKKAVKAYGDNFQHTDKLLRDDKLFVLELLNDFDNFDTNHYVYRHASERLKKDREVILASLKHGGVHRLDGVDRELLKDETFIEEAIKRSGYGFEYATKEQQSNRELVKNALKLNASALQYVNKEFRKDKEFILQLLKEKSEVFSYIDEKLKKDRGFVLKAIEIDGTILSDLDDILRKDKEIVELALTQTACAMCAVDESLINDTSYLLYLIKTTGVGFNRLTKEQKSDRALILEILDSRGLIYRDLNETQKQDKEFIEMALKDDGWVLDDLPDNLKKDRALITLALEQNGWVIQSVPAPLNRDREVVLLALNEDGLILKHLDKDLRENREYVLKALRADPKALTFVDNELAKNQEFLIEAINTPKLFKYMDKSLLEDEAFIQKLKEVTGFTPNIEEVEEKKKEVVYNESFIDVNSSLMKEIRYKDYDDYGIHESDWGYSSDITENQKYIVTVRNQEIFVWDVNSSLLVKQIALKQPTRSLALVDNSTSVLTELSKEIKIWDLETGVLKSTIFKGDKYINKMSLSPNRKWLAFLSDNMIYICNVKSRKIIQKFKLNSELVSRFTIDNNAKYLIVGKEKNHEIVIWDIQNVKKITTLWGHSNTPYHLVVSPNQKYLVSADFYGYIKIWDMKSKKLLRTLYEKEAKSVHSLDISKDGKWLLTTSSNIKIWNLETGKLLKSFSPSKGLGSAKFINKDRHILSNENHSLRIRDISSLKVVQELKTLKEQVYTAHLSSNGKYLILGFRSSINKTKAAIWDINKNKLFKVIESNSRQAVSSLEVSKDNKYLFMAYGDGAGGGANVHVKMWDIEHNKLVKTFRNKNANVKDRENIFDIALSPNGKYFVTFLNSGGREEKKNIELWSVESGKLIGLFSDLSGGRVRPIVVISQDSKWLILGDEKGGINFYSIKSKKLIKRVEISDKAINKIALFDKDKLLISAGSKVYLRSLTKDENLKTFNIGKKVVFKIITSENNEIFVLDYISSGLEAWNIYKDKPIFSSKVEIHYVNIGSIVDLSNDAKKIVMVFDDGSVRVSSIDNIEKANKIFVFGDKKNWVVFDEVNKTMNLMDEGSFLLKKREVSKDENMTLFEFERLRRDYKKEGKYANKWKREFK